MALFELIEERHNRARRHSALGYHYSINFENNARDRLHRFRY